MNAPRLYVLVLPIVCLIAVLCSCTSSAPDASDAEPQKGADRLVAQYLQAAHLGAADAASEASQADARRLFRSAAEAELLTQMRAREVAGRLAILDTVVAAAGENLQVLTRLEDVTHAVVGLDSAVRDRVIETVVRPRCAEGVSSGEQLAAARIGIFLQVRDEIPGFAEFAVQRFLAPRSVSEPVSQGTLGRKIEVVFQQLSEQPFEKKYEWLKELMADERVDQYTLIPSDALILDWISRADPDQPVAEYGELMLWLLDHMRYYDPLPAPHVESSQAIEEEKVAAAYLQQAVKRNSQPACAVLQGEQAATRVRRLAVYFPELFGQLPEDFRQQAAAREMGEFLTALEAGSTSDISAAAGEQNRFPLYLARDHLARDQRRRLATAIAERIESNNDVDTAILVNALTEVAVELEPDEVITVLEVLGRSKPAPDTMQYSRLLRQHEQLGSAVSDDAADKMANWIFQQHAGESAPQELFHFVLHAVADRCRPDTAVRLVQYAAEHIQVTHYSWPIAAARIVPVEAATELAEGLVAAAETEQYDSLAMDKLRLAGSLRNADAALRNRAFDTLLQQAQPDPSAGGGSSADRFARERFLRISVSPAVQDILSNWPAEDRQEAVLKLLDLLGAGAALPEALVLADGLLVLAPDWTEDQSAAVLEQLIRLAAEDKQFEEMPKRLDAFLMKANSPNRGKLIEPLLSFVVQEDSLRERHGNQVVVLNLLVAAAQSCSSADACQSVRCVFDLGERYNRCPEDIHIGPFLRHVDASDRESLASDLVQRMQDADTLSCNARLAQAVARLSVDPDTCAAAADRLIDLLAAHVQRPGPGGPGSDDQSAAQLSTPLRLLVQKMATDRAVEQRERLVSVLCHTVYGSDSLPAKPTVKKISGTRVELGNGIVQVIGVPKAMTSPETMTTIMYCVVSLAAASSPDARDAMARSTRGSVYTLPAGTGLKLAEACVAGVLDLAARDWCLMLVGTKMHDDDFPRAYEVAWTAYRRARTKGGFGQCLLTLAERLPAASASSAAEKLLRDYPSESQGRQIMLLRDLAVVLATRLPESQRAELAEIISQRGRPKPVLRRSQTCSPPTTGLPGCVLHWGRASG